MQAERSVLQQPLRINARHEPREDGRHSPEPLASRILNHHSSRPMRIAAPPIVLSCLLAACASTGSSQVPPGWTKPGASQEVMEAEASECRSGAQSSYGSAEAAAAVATVHCLVSKGWRQVR